MSAAQQPDPTSPHAYARAYAEQGLRVIPIAPGYRYPKGFDAWQRHASNDRTQIDAWWGGKYAQHGVGIATGPGSNVWVFDVDTKPGKDGVMRRGQATLDALLDTFGEDELPATWTAKTNSGHHYFWRWDPDCPIVNQQGVAQPFGDGIDVRGDGGQVVAAPSAHPKGGRYAWVEGRAPWECELAEAPAWMYSMWAKARDDEADAQPRLEVKPPSLHLIPGGDEVTPADWVRHNVDMLELLRVDGWTEARRQGEQVHLTRPGKAVRDGISAVWHLPDGPLNVFSTSVATHGLGKVSKDGSVISLSTFDVYAIAHHGGDLRSASSAVRRDLMPRRERHGDLTSAELVGEQAPPPEVIEANLDPEVERANRILAGLLRGDEIMHMPPPDPMVGDWLDRGMVFSIVGAYGTAKTFVLLDMALAVATGTPWLDQPIHHTGPVLYIVAEGGYTIGPRVRGWCRHHDIDDVPEQFLVYPDRVNLLNEIQRAELVEAAIELQPALVIIDTMAQSMPGGDENSSVDMSMIFEAVDRVRKETGASVGFARHTGHGVKGRGRGFSGFEDNSDVVFSVEGKVKDGPVRLESQKQKARENPMPLAVALTIDEGGDPFLRVTSTGPNVGTSDERLTKARQVLLSATKRYRGSEGLPQREWVERAPGVTKEFRHAAFAELVEDGYFVPHDIEVPFGTGTRTITRFTPNKEMLDEI